MIGRMATTFAGARDVELEKLHDAKSKSPGWLCWNRTIYQCFCNTTRAQSWQMSLDCYAERVTSTRKFRGLARPCIQWIAFACAACTTSVPPEALTEPPTSSQRMPESHTQATDRPLARWWEIFGDPVLVRLVDRALVANRSQSPICGNDRKVQGAERNGTDAEPGTLFEAGGRRQALARAEQEASAYRNAKFRARRTREVGLAYIAARRWQETVEADRQAVEQLNDNHTVARFRREAGLVSTIDEGLSGTQSDLTQAAAERHLAAFEESLINLAKITGETPQNIRTLLADDGTLPEIPATLPNPEDPANLADRADLLALERSLLANLIREGVSQDDIDAAFSGSTDTDSKSIVAARQALTQLDRARIAARGEIAALRDRTNDAADREAQAQRTYERAQLTARDARSAYRTGMLDFSMLYVAEAAALATSHALTEAKAEKLVSLIRLWDAQGGGWSYADLPSKADERRDSPKASTCE